MNPTYPLFDLLVQYVFLLMPLGYHLFHDVSEINDRHRSPNHPVMAFIVLGLSLILGWFLRHTFSPHFWKFALYAMSIHFALFNYLLNYMRSPREPAFYLANGFWDRLLKKIPPQIRVLVQLVILIGAGLIYHL